MGKVRETFGTAAVTDVSNLPPGRGGACLSSCVAIVLAAALAADGPVNQVAPPGAVAGAQPQASPPPPEVVVLETYYGTVTLDHRAHLAMEAPCSGCHDPGAVSKIKFTPKVAHDRCVGCHKEQGAARSSARAVT